MSVQNWTEQRVDNLKRLWADGYSASEIAAELDFDCSRSAVLGKVDRLGLEKRNKVTYRAPKLKRARQRSMPLWVAPRDPLPIVEPETSPKPFLGIRLIDLEPHHCRYPRGGDDGAPILFCGQPNSEDSSYCAACGRRCRGGKQFISDAERERRRQQALRMLAGRRAA